MKKTLLFSLSVGFIALCSYKSGPALSGLNRTGSAGSTANCSTGGCHDANSTNTIVTVILTKNGVPVTKFLPDSIYIVKISGAVTNANLPRFGFQISSVNSNSTSVQAGTLTALNTSTAIRSVGSIQIVEHTSAIPGVGSGNIWGYSDSASWKAPSASAGINSVRFYATLNAVNFNNSDAGDQPNTATPYDVANGLSVSEISTLTSLQTFPNPATNSFNVVADAANGIYHLQVVSLNGQTLAVKAVNVTNGKMAEKVTIDNWAPGMYFMCITDISGNVKRIPVTKI